LKTKLSTQFRADKIMLNPTLFSLLYMIILLTLKYRDFRSDYLIVPASIRPAEIICQDEHNMRLLAVDSCQLPAAPGAAVNCLLTANRCQLQAALNYSKDLRFDVFGCRRFFGTTFNSPAS
jgi:hypothetical protein